MLMSPKVMKTLLLNVFSSLKVAILSFKMFYHVANIMGTFLFNVL